MRPSEALPQDWPLYYAGTFMLHNTMGPVYVQVDGPRLLALKLTKNFGEPDQKPPEQVKPEELSVWFPKTGAFNTSKSASYIARRAARSMRKSLSIGELYYVAAGEKLSTRDCALLLANKHVKYTPALSAIIDIRNGKYTGRAISRDIILYSRYQHQRIGVFFKGILVGTLRQKGGTLDFLNPKSSLNKVIEAKLRKEGITCASLTK